MSREPSAEHKIQFPSIVELKDGLIALTNRVARRVRFRGRKLRPGPLMNAVLVYYMTLPEEEQVRIADAGMRRYEALLGSDDPRDDLMSVPVDRVPPEGRGAFLGGSIRKVGPKPKSHDKPSKAE